MMNELKKNELTEQEMENVSGGASLSEVFDVVADAVDNAWDAVSDAASTVLDIVEHAAATRKK